MRFEPKGTTRCIPDGKDRLLLIAAVLLAVGMVNTVFNDTGSCAELQSSPGKERLGHL